MQRGYEEMICRHCGKEYSDEFAYCPYCAEPKPINNNISNQEQISEEEQIKRSYKGADGHYFLVTFVVGFIWFAFGYFVCQFLGWTI